MKTKCEKLRTDFEEAIKTTKDLINEIVLGTFTYSLTQIYKYFVEEGCKLVWKRLKEKYKRKKDQLSLSKSGK